MLTNAAAATTEFARASDTAVSTVPDLVRDGCTRSEAAAWLRAGRWHRFGKAVVLHNGELTREERGRVGVLNCGPRAYLGSFSAIESMGLKTWERDEVHVLAPSGVPRPRLGEPHIVLHHTADLAPVDVLEIRRCQRIAPALVLAASSFTNPRPACGILAAGVQQRLTTPSQLRAVLDRAPRVRHRHDLLLAVNDIAGGAEALSEIDFVRLCRRHRLPPPTQQRIRLESGGRRRFLDAEWRLPDGRVIAAEIDGAVHLAVRKWWDDQLRQNEIVITGTWVLRYPSVIVRTELALVADLLRRSIFS
ncbi:MAG TPA: hypothetical protein VGH30_04310 [Jatrophihabitantaceae bacterium]